MRIHVHLRVRDLEASTRFYSALFGMEPTFRRHDYAKWSLEKPHLNLAIVASRNGSGLGHLGLEAGSPDELRELRARAARTDGPLRDEGETICCYARSDKSWLDDPAGVPWEVFYTHGLAEEATSAAASPAGTAEGSRCCGPECCGDQPESSSQPAGCC